MIDDEERRERCISLSSSLIKEKIAVRQNLLEAIVFIERMCGLRVACF